jgi:hypothetical protein
VNGLAKAADPNRYNLFGWFLSAKNDLYVLYAAVIAVILFTLVRTFMYIRRISKKYPYEVINNLKFYNTSEPGTPFSFFRSIFWNRELTLDSEKGQQIFRHELFHVQQRHTVDIMLTEIITACFWYNPLFHIIKKELKAIHEFLADQYAASGSDRYAYAELLVQQTISSGRLSLSNYFFQNHIKRRIAMITQLKKGRYNYWSRLMPLPVAALLFCSIALYAKPNPNSPHNGIPVVSNSNIITDTTPKREKRLRYQDSDDQDNIKNDQSGQDEFRLKLNTDDLNDKEKIRAYINSLTTEQLREMLRNELQKRINYEVELQYKKALLDKKTSDVNNEAIKDTLLNKEQALMEAKLLNDKQDKLLRAEDIRIQMKQLADRDREKSGSDLLTEKGLEEEKYLSQLSNQSNDLIKMKELNGDQIRKAIQDQQSKIQQYHLDLEKLNNDQSDHLVDAEKRASEDNMILQKKLKGLSDDKLGKDVLLSKQAEIRELREAVRQLEMKMQQLQDEMERKKKDE